MKERDLLNWVIDCAEATGWKVWHVPAPMVADRRSGQWRPFKRAAGLPDLFMLHDDPPRLIIAEVKGTGGKLSDAQRKFLRAAAGVVDQIRVFMHPTPGLPLAVYVWEPGQEAIIEQILKSKVLL